MLTHPSPGSVLIGLLVVLGQTAAPAWALPGPHRRSDALRAVPSPPDGVPVRAPLVADVPGVREAVETLLDGRAEEAAAALTALRDEAPPALQPYVDYLIARCDVELDRPDTAAATFARLEAALPALRGHLRVHRARLALDRGDDDEAERLARALRPIDHGYVDLLFELARRRASAGRHADVLAIVERLEPALFWRWERARAARLSADARYGIDDDRAAWLARIADIWRRWPRTLAGREAEEVLLPAFAAGETPLTVDEVLAAMASHARQPGPRFEALAEALTARMGNAAGGLEVLIEGEQTWRQRPAELLDAVEAALPAAQVPAVRDALLDLKARVLRRLDRYTEALDIYRRLGRAASSPRRRAEALLEGGDVARVLRRLDEARWFYDRYLARHARTHEGGELRAHALWRLAWIAWREGLLEEADTWFGMLIDEHPTAEDRSGRTYYERALYWRARFHQRRGRVERARAIWRFLAERFPLSYYAALSESWLWRTGAGAEGPPSPPEGADESPPRVSDLESVEPAAATAVALYRMGLEREARLALRHLFNLGRLGPDGTALLSALYRREGDYWRAHWIAENAFPLESDPDGPHRDRWLAAFPRPFAEEVRAEAAEHDVHAALIWAVMRQESGFRVRARSYRRAHGLMQVIYPTARFVARKLLGERTPRLRDVYSVRGNIHYGTAYLRHLLDRFHGHLALAIAGYNAGPGAVERWLRRFGHLEADEFVEEIPYDEARGYTRKVLRSLAGYRHLYGETDAPDPRRMPMVLPPLRTRPVVSVAD